MSSKVYKRTESFFTDIQNKFRPDLLCYYLPYLCPMRCIWEGDWGCGGDDSNVRYMEWSAVTYIPGEAGEAELVSVYTVWSMCKTPNQTDSLPYLSPLLAWLRNSKKDIHLYIYIIMNIHSEEYAQIL